jgi:hypothetical protein
VDYHRTATVPLVPNRDEEARHELLQDQSSRERDGNVVAKDEVVRVLLLEDAD